MNTQLHVAIIDDEDPIRECLREFLSTRTSVETVSEIAQGSKAPEVIGSENPDLVFLDVKMSSKSGVEIVEEVGPDSMPTTIFMSRNDKFAALAFDFAAIDYLRKPLDDVRVEQAFERASRAVKLRQLENLASHLQAVVEGLGTRIDSSDNGTVRGGTGGVTETDASSDYLDRVTVEVQGQIHVIPVEDIRYISAEDTYVRIHTEDRTHLLRERLYEMEDQLDPAEFVRIHRSTIVRLECVQRLLQRSAGDYVVQLDDQKTLHVSRSRQEELIRRLEIGASA